jgi:hypothetical protein
VKLVIVIFSLTIFGTLPAFSQISSPVDKFIRSFPDKLTCDGIEESGLLEPKGRPLDKRVSIIISNKDSAATQIEVIAPSATESLRHFKIGNGYGGNLEHIGTFSYFYGSSEQRLYYLRSLNEGATLDYRDVLRARSSGLIYFSARSICVSGFHCILISNCLTE